MSETKFTKCPWILVAGDRFQLDLIITSKTRDNSSIAPIAQLDFDFNGEIGCEQKANAHLIASAPEMYEEIESDINEIKEFILTLKPYSDDWLFYTNKLKRKEGLLAKARGENA
jgi:hypothetical protein